MNQYLKHNFSPGFTLVETLVAMAAFAILVTLVGGVMIGALGVQQRAAAVQQVEENASFILETMAKEIRVATLTSTEAADCSASTLQFTRIDPVTTASQDVQYRLSGTDLQRTVNGTATIINTSAIQFTNLRFCILGRGISDHLQPRITIIASVKTKDANQSATMDIQTTLSQRFLND